MSGWRGEVEDGLGWGGLVPTKAERAEEARQARAAAERYEMVEVLRLASQMDQLRSLSPEEREIVKQLAASARAVLTKSVWRKS